MSVILSNASRLKAEIRLAQAVSQFEADLSSDQKAMFRSYKAQSHNTPPSPEDVMLLTGQIDLRAGEKVVGGRCFGPRFFNVLQAVQQFAALGDIIIGGSQNLIACGVWSLVRMTLLMVVSSTSYLEKLSALFMTAGRSAPRYQMMALLYPRSKSLQSSLSEYFIVIVRLCHQLLRFTKKSTLGQIVSSLSDSDLKTAEAELIAWSGAIKEEVSLLLNQKIDEEVQENSRFRALSSVRSATTSHHKKLRQTRRVLDACSIYDYQTTWKQIRKLGNATILDHSTEYHNWKDCQQSSTIICMGKLGSGKSVLLANVVDDIHMHVQDQEQKIAVAYFFCRHDIPESLKIRTIIGSLARQLLRTVPDLSSAEEFLDENAPVLTVEDMFSLLRRILCPNGRAYFILDGLGECSEGDRQAVTDLLKALQEAFSLFLFISYRQEAENTAKTQRLLQTSIVSIPESNPDIGGYITAELERSLRNETLSIGDPSLILEIRDTLVRGAQGMFLWVSLQLKSLCAEKTDEAIRQALMNLPKDLPETFSRILKRSEGAGKYQQYILKLVIAAQRPLTTDELGEALSVDPGNATWNPARVVNDSSSMLACCGSLAIVDEEEFTVRLVHHSVKQFLLGGSESSTGIPFTFRGANSHMANVVVTYLNYGIFETQLSSVVVPEINTESAPSKIIRSSLNSSSLVRSLALQLLASRNQPNYDIGKVLAGASKQFKVGLIDEHYFYAYAMSFWSYHIWAIAAVEDPPMYDLLRDFIRRNEHRSTDPSIPGVNSFQWIMAVRHGNVPVVKLLLENSKLDVNSTDEHGQTPLIVAIICGQEGIVELFLDSSKINANTRDEFGQTPLLCAVKYGHESIVSLLIASGKCDLNLKDQSGWSPLGLATIHKHKSIVSLLLDRNANVNLEDIYQHFPPERAFDNEHEAISHLLLDKVIASATSQEEKELHRPLIAHAAYHGYRNLVEVLLRPGYPNSNVNCRDDLGRTPLALAVLQGHLGVVKLLLGNHSVNANSTDNNGSTPLLLAAFRCNDDMVKLLVNSDVVDVNVADPYMHRTTLSYVSMVGDESIVKLLLDSGKCYVRLIDTLGKTAYDLALDAGYLRICSLLQPHRLGIEPE